MEKDRRARIIAIAALLVGVVGLSLGFAAFTNTLTIQSSAEVNVDDTVFNVDFSTQTASVVAGNVTPTLDPTNGPAGFTGGTATIDNSADGAPVIEDLHATFTAPGQSVTYTFYTKNAGQLKAYLTSVNFANVSGESATKVCTAKAVQSPATPATNSLVQSACSSISLTVALGPTATAESFTATTARSSFTTATAHDLDAGAYEQVVVTIAYAANAAQADGDFDVAFGDVTLNYSSVAS